MDGETRGGFFVRWRAKDIQAEVVSHDAAQKLALGIRAVLRMSSGIVGGGLDGIPWRSPQRVHTARLVKNFGDVPAFMEDSNANLVVFDGGSAPAAITDLWHKKHYATGSTSPRTAGRQNSQRNRMRGTILCS